MTQTFENMNLPATVMKSLTRMKFTTPTPIQERAIPLAMEGRDVLGSAQTGTGKTGAFAIPLMVRLLNNPQSKAVILAPTRELAVQVMDTVRQMQNPSEPIAAAVLIGGEVIQKQFKQLKRNPRIIVGTPGRINDHLERKTLSLKGADFLVLDEMDRMLDMGFGIQVDTIIDSLAKKRQTLMFSATMPRKIVQMAEKYLTNPERIAVGSTTKPMENITQELIKTTVEEKYLKLLDELHSRSGSVIIFVKTKRGADRMVRKLNRDDYPSDALHGDLKQSRRDRVTKAFRNKEYRILVATDVAARGLDIPHIEHVINYDLPQMAEDYIHRVGRTARAGASGSAVCFVTPDEEWKWTAIQRLIKEGKDGEPRGGHGDHKSTPKKSRVKKGRKKSFKFKQHDRRKKDNGKKSEAA